jgi:hypothetical protein
MNCLIQDEFLNPVAIVDCWAYSSSEYKHERNKMFELWVGELSLREDSKQLSITNWVVSTDISTFNVRLGDAFINTISKKIASNLCKERYRN